jgi:predicted dehydrogenase
MNRRGFFRSTAALGAGYWLTASALSASRAADKPNEQLQFACIGVGGKGHSDTSQVANLGVVVALCDVDDDFLNGKAGEFKNSKHADAKKYFDYRKLLDEMGKQIDAVTVSTPDHNHAPASIMAMKLGKHVYCQKPLTHSVYEARLMRKTAKDMKVCTQMGNQGTAANGLRRATEFIQSGGLGKVTEAHVWTNRPIWPQAPGIVARPKTEVKVPDYLHWDEWLGPAAFRPYHHPGDPYDRKVHGTYHDFNWRGWWDFGTGAIGDMGCHTANMAYMALKLGLPHTISAQAGDVNPETCPSFAHVLMEFAARGDMPPVAWHWYEGRKNGKNVLPSPELVKGQGKRETEFAVFFDKDLWQFKSGKKTAPVHSGSFLVGEKGVLFSPDDYGADAYIVTEDAVTRLTGKPEKLPTNNGGDQGMKNEWVKAIRENNPAIALSNFDYAAMLTEAILLGNVAIRCGEKITYDGNKGVVTNSATAAQYIKREYRKGWEL